MIQIGFIVVCVLLTVCFVYFSTLKDTPAEGPVRPAEDAGKPMAESKSDAA